jgi:hypothetical protein
MPADKVGRHGREGCKMDEARTLKGGQGRRANARKTPPDRSRTEATSDVGTRISTLWVVVMLNMAYADVLTFIKPGALQALWAGQAGVQLTPVILLVFAILLEIPIAMIVLSRILPPAASRWANTIAAAVTTAFVVGGGSLDLYYAFFAAVEIACMALIVWSVWTRRDSEGRPQ